MENLPNNLTVFEATARLQADGEPAARSQSDDVRPVSVNVSLKKQQPTTTTGPADGHAGAGHRCSGEQRVPGLVAGWQPYRLPYRPDGRVGDLGDRCRWRQRAADVRRRAGRPSAGVHLLRGARHRLDLVRLASPKRLAGKTDDSFSGTPV